MAALPDVVTIPCPIPECAGALEVDVKIRGGDARPSGHVIVLDMRATGLHSVGEHTHEPIDRKF